MLSGMGRLLGRIVGIAGHQEPWSTQAQAPASGTSSGSESLPRLLAAAQSLGDAAAALQERQRSGKVSEKLCLFLQARAKAGRFEAAVRCMRKVADSGEPLPGIGCVSKADLVAAMAEFEKLKAAVQEQQREAPVWITSEETPWHQGASLQSPLLRRLPKGEQVVEITDVPRAFPGWVAIQPRGWVPRDALDLGQAGLPEAMGSLTLSRQQGSAPVESLPGQAMDLSHGKRPLPPQVEGRRCRPRLDAPAMGCELTGAVYVLDALNILKHRNDEARPIDLEWPQLAAAGQYYKQRGLKALAFLRRTGEWSPKDADVQQLKAELGQDFVVRCPPGKCDDGFMINFARDFEADGGSARVRIVTNDQFRDHRSVVDAAWTRKHTVGYAFVLGRFVPELEGR